MALCIQAAAKGHLPAVRELGYCFEDGLGVPEDRYKGQQLLLLAAMHESELLGGGEEEEEEEGGREQQQQQMALQEQEEVQSRPTAGMRETVPVVDEPGEGATVTPVAAAAAGGQSAMHTIKSRPSLPHVLIDLNHSARMEEAGDNEEGHIGVPRPTMLHPIPSGSRSSSPRALQGSRSRRQPASHQGQSLSAGAKRGGKCLPEFPSSQLGGCQAAEQASLCEEWYVTSCRTTRTAVVSAGSCHSGDTQQEVDAHRAESVPVKGAAVTVLRASDSVPHHAVACNSGVTAGSWEVGESCCSSNHATPTPSTHSSDSQDCPISSEPAPPSSVPYASLPRRPVPIDPVHGFLLAWYDECAANGMPPGYILPSATKKTQAQDSTMVPSGARSAPGAFTEAHRDLSMAREGIHATSHMCRANPVTHSPPVDIITAPGEAARDAGTPQQLQRSAEVHEDGAQEQAYLDELMMPTFNGTLWASLQLCSNSRCGRKETFPDEFRCCSVCREARYCSRNCQAIDWCAGHRIACTMLTEAMAEMGRQFVAEVAPL